VCPTAHALRGYRRGPVGPPAAPGSVGNGPVDNDAALIAALRAGDEDAFASLVDRYGPTMLRVAREFVSSREAAEDVVQETFLGVITGIDRFEARSSLKTWIFRILVNRAKTRGRKESRSRPFSALSSDEVARDDPAVDPDRFVHEGEARGVWAAPPSTRQLPEAGVLAGEVGAHLAAAIRDLPPAQRAVVELRDVHGLSSPEVCELLDLSEGNQRVLLHRGRSKLRAALEQYVNGE